ncbi:MAG: hypothetical protein ACKOUM_05795 [Sphingopyxis sp.]
MNVFRPDDDQPAGSGNPRHSARQSAPEPAPRQGGSRILTALNAMTGGGLRDGWDYMMADRPHRWPALGLALVVPALVMYFIARSLNPVETPKRTIIYVESWPLDRSEYDTRRAWLQRAAQANDANEQRRGAYGRFAQSIGQEFDATKAKDEFAQSRADIAQALRELDVAERNHAPLPILPGTVRRMTEPNRTTPAPGPAGSPAPNAHTGGGATSSPAPAPARASTTPAQ